jgi:hypothetical protein
MNATVFYESLRDVLIPRIREFRVNQRPESLAVLFLDNCSIDLKPEMLQLFPEKRVKVITFLLHSIELFQILDFVFLGVFERAKKRLPKDPAVPIMKHHAKHMLNACDKASARTMVQISFTQGKEVTFPDSAKRRFTNQVVSEK